MESMLFAFQEQTTEDDILLNGFGSVVNALGKRTRDYLPQICGTILWRLNNKSAKASVLIFLIFFFGTSNTRDSICITILSSRS